MKKKIKKIKLEVKCPVFLLGHFQRFLVVVIKGRLAVLQLVVQPFLYVEKPVRPSSGEVFLEEPTPGGVLWSQVQALVMGVPGRIGNQPFY